MASRAVSDLVPEAQSRAELTLKLCRDRGVDLLIYCTLRTLQEQARIYRQSRSFAAIEQKAVRLSSAGFGYLAEVLIGVGPQYGPHVTNAGPGESWHNFGEAFDAVPVLGGKPVWSYESHRDLWDAYGECAEQAGMHWAGRWTSFREYPHAQLRPEPNPLRFFSPFEVRSHLTMHDLV